MSKRGGALLQEDVPWRASPTVKPLPKIHHSPVLRLPQTPYSNYALSVMKHPNPVGSGLGSEAIVESAGPDCIVPGQITPIRFLGLKVWPIYIDLTFLEPVERQLKTIGKMDLSCSPVEPITYFTTRGLPGYFLTYSFTSGCKIVDSAFDIMDSSFRDR